MEQNSPETPCIIQSDIDTMLKVGLDHGYVAGLLRHAGIQLSLPSPLPKMPSESAVLSSIEIATLRQGGALLESAPNSKSKADARVKLQHLASACAKIIKDSLDSGAVSKRLNISDSEAESLASRSPPAIFAFKLEGALLYPQWQFTDSGTIPHLEAVLAITGGEKNPFLLTEFMVRDNPDLEVDGVATSPRDWLLSGLSANLVLILADDI